MSEKFPFIKPPASQIRSDGPTPGLPLSMTGPFVPDGATLTQIPADNVKPGWMTSEGQLTGIFVLAGIALSAVGLHYTPDQIHGYFDAIMGFVKIVGPLAAVIPVAWNYITSRGKTKSNAINAAASVVRAQTEAQAESDRVKSMQMSEYSTYASSRAMPSESEESKIDTLVDLAHPDVAALFGASSILKMLLGGKSWKDPERYKNIASIVAQASGNPKAQEAVEKGIGVVDTIRPTAADQIGDIITSRGFVDRPSLSDPVGPGRHIDVKDQYPPMRAASSDPVQSNTFRASDAVKANWPETPEEELARLESERAQTQVRLIQLREKIAKGDSSTVLTVDDEG